LFGLKNWLSGQLRQKIDKPEKKLPGC
jgi:hypothetical protein